MYMGRERESVCVCVYEKVAKNGKGERGRNGYVVTVGTIVMNQRHERAPITANTIWKEVA